MTVVTSPLFPLITRFLMGSLTGDMLMEFILTITMSALQPGAILPRSPLPRALAALRVTELKRSREVATPGSPSTILEMVAARPISLMMSMGYVSVPMPMFTPSMRYRA